MTRKDEIAEKGDNQIIDVKALRTLVEDAKKIKKRQDDSRMDMLANKNKASDMGMERKAYNAMLKEIFSPVSQEHKDKVNEYLVAYRGLPLFDHAMDTKEAA